MRPTLLCFTIIFQCGATSHVRKIARLRFYVYVKQHLACSRRSDSRAREKNSRRKNKRFPGVQLDSLPTELAFQSDFKFGANLGQEP